MRFPSVCQVEKRMACAAGAVSRERANARITDRARFASLQAHSTTYYETLEGTQQEAQTFAVKRAEVEFHNFASLGEPERALEHYAIQNRNRAAVIRKHLPFIGPMTPFLEIGANVGHSSYMLASEFGAEGFALDISADALRHGIEQFPGPIVRIAGDAAKLPFRDESLQFVMAFQMLSQFSGIEQVFLEVKRVLRPGGVFFFADEPMLRQLSLRLYRAPYYDLMRPWERRLHNAGLLGYLVKDVIGAQQEENFGIRQNHTMYLADWERLIRKHFAALEYETFVPERGWGESIVRKIAGGRERQARLLGGTLAAFCKKAGTPQSPLKSIAQFAQFLQCPDCGGNLAQETDAALICSNCEYRAASEGGVYTVLPSAEREELYPGDRSDIIDFSLAGHEARLGEGWGELEGRDGAQYRWVGSRSTATLAPITHIPLRLRMRGHAHQQVFSKGEPVRVRVSANGQQLPELTLDRAGLFIYEADLEPAGKYDLSISCSPTFSAPPDQRVFSLTFSMLRLVPRQ